MPTRILAALVVLLVAAGAAHAQGSFVNWESPPVHPVDMTPDGTTLLVVNTADDRLEVFTLGGALPVHVASIPVGLDPVTVRARTNGEAWVVNRVSDSVSIVDLAAGNVTATLTVGDEPADVVFAGAPQRAFVSISEENAVAVYDPANLATAPTTVAIQGKNPRALATDGTRVYVAIFESGNRSMILPASYVSNRVRAVRRHQPAAQQRRVVQSAARARPPGAAADRPHRQQGRRQLEGRQQPHLGRARDVEPERERRRRRSRRRTSRVTYAKNVLNINMAIAVNPATGRVTPVGTLRAERAPLRGERAQQPPHPPRLRRPEQHRRDRRRRRPEPAPLPQPAESAVPEDERDARRAPPGHQRPARHRLARRTAAPST